MAEQWNNTMWHFYTTEHQLWRWQHMSVNRKVLAASHAGYETLERCLVDAQRNGYVFEPAQAATVPRCSCDFVLSSFDDAELGVSLA